LPDDKPGTRLAGSCFAIPERGCARSVSRSALKMLRLVGTQPRSTKSATDHSSTAGEPVIRKRHGKGSN